MICSAKPVLTKYLFVIQKEEFSKAKACYMCYIRTLDERPDIFIRDKHILSSKRMLDKG
jgi:hypothetical protein